MGVLGSPGDLRGLLCLRHPGGHGCLGGLPGLGDINGLGGLIGVGDLGGLGNLIGLCGLGVVGGSEWSG